MAKCPYCEQTVTLEAARKETEEGVRKDVDGTFKKEVMYSCPHCDKVLGFAFFLGGTLLGRP